MPTTITSLLTMMAVAMAIAVIFAAGARPALADQDQAPTGLTLTATDANTVQATWTAHPDGARDYRLSWAPHDENFKTWTDTDWNAFPTGNSYAIPGLEGGSTYKVKVRARFETGPPSDWSGIVTATTTVPPEPTPAPTPQPTPEATPEPAIDYDQERSASVSLGDITNAAAENRDETVDTDDPVDYFHFSLTHQRTVELRIRRLDYNADLYVEDNDGAVIASSENGGNRKEVLNLTLAATGANEYYYVRVEAKEDGRNDYQLRYFTDAPPNAAATGAPALSGAAQVRETLTAGVSGIADDNGLSNASFDYQWVRSVDGTDTDIAGATGSTFLLTYDELDHTVRVRVSFTDDAGYPETLTSAATATVVRPPNASPGGQPAITGTVEVGETLTVGTSGISDPNGLSNPQYAYQWIRSIGSTDTDISGATGSTYTLTASDLAHTVKVKASFTDDDGYAETLTSAPTEVPDTENSDCAEPPVGLASAVNDDTSAIVLTWEAPANCTPDSYAVYRRTISEDGNRMAKIATVDDAGLAYTDDNVSAGEKYRYRVRSNDQGPRSGWTQTVMTEPVPGERTDRSVPRNTVTLISNTGQTTSTNAVIVGVVLANKHSSAIKFTTGSATNVYTITEASVKLGNVGANSIPKVSIYTSTSGLPGTLVFTFTNPGSIVSGLNTFTAPADSTLAGSDDYFVVLESDSSSFYNIATTASTTDDAGAATGWSLGDSRHGRSTDGGAWTDQGTGSIPQVAIKGSDQPPPPPEVTIEADATSAVYREDASAFTLSRTGATTDTLAVAVELTQIGGRFISDENLSKTVTFAVGSATAALSVDHQQPPLGEAISSGTLTATVVDGTDYDLGTADTAEMDIIVAMMSGFDMDSYTVSEEAGSLQVKLVGRTGVGAPAPGTVRLSVSTEGGDQSDEEFPASSPEDCGALSVVAELLSAEFVPDGDVFREEYTFNVQINDDDVDEEDETFFLVLERTPGLFDKYANRVDASGGVICNVRDCRTPITIIDTDPVSADIDSLAFTNMPASGSYYETGETVTVGVTYDEAVVVDTTNGTPTLELSIGDVTRSAAYSGVSIDNLVLTFSYEIVGTDRDQDGISIPSGSLALNGGTIILDGTTDAAHLVHNGKDASGSRRVNKAPEVVSGGVIVTSTPVAGTDTYGAGETIRFTVTFDAPVTVDTTGGTPRLKFRLADGGNNNNSPANRNLDYVSGTETETLTFEYEVVSGDSDTTGVYMNANALQRNNGTIKRHTTGRDAVLDHARPGASGNFPGAKVDGTLTPPVATLTGLTLTEVTLDQTFAATTRSYTADVANSVAVTTVTATAETGATAVVSPADSNGRTAGHQVTLDVGETAITVEVTKPGAVTRTYTVTVTREAPTLVSNIGQDRFLVDVIVGASGPAQHSRTQSFKTGNNATGYTLSEVRVRFGVRDAGAEPKMTIYTATANGTPVSFLYEMIPPTTVRANSVNTFTAPAGATLEPSISGQERWYSMVFEDTSSDKSYRLKYTTSDDEDSGGEQGWEIGDNHRSRTSDGGSWTTNAPSLSISIRGIVNPGSYDETLADTFVTVSEPDGQDFPDSEATRGRVVVGANGATGFLSTTDTEGAGDAFKISLAAGRRYRVEVLADAYRDVGHGGDFPGSPVLSVLDDQSGFGDFVRLNGYGDQTVPSNYNSPSNVTNVGSAADNGARSEFDVATSNDNYLISVGGDGVNEGTYTVWAWDITSEQAFGDFTSGFVGGRLKIGDEKAMEGEIQSSRDNDWYMALLEDNKCYAIHAKGQHSDSDQNGGTLGDPEITFMKFYDYYEKQYYDPVTKEYVRPEFTEEFYETAFIDRDKCTKIFGSQSQCYTETFDDGATSTTRWFCNYYGDDDGGEGNNAKLEVKIEAGGGGEYLISVDGVGPSKGTYSLFVEEIDCPTQ